MRRAARRGPENTLLVYGRQGRRRYTFRVGALVSKTMKRLCLAALLIAGVPVAMLLAQRGAAAPVTFARDIAPVLYVQCAPCHRPDGPAPFSLVTYEDARRHAAQIAVVTRRRYMPPWKPEPEFGDFAGARRLTGDQILAMERWLAGGLLEGDASELPPPPRWTPGWQLGEPDLVVSLPEYTLAADGADVFRNFVVSVPGSA